MFYYLHGTVALIDLGLVVLECGGVGFSVNTTTTTMAKLKPGESARLYTHCAIREDAFDIFGFATKRELDTFRLLIGVNGVGPKAALAILSTVTPDGLHMAVVTQNEKSLTAAPGVGKKLAQRILLELKDKLGAQSELDFSSGDGGFAPVLQPGSKATEAVQALQVLGYDQNSISAAMKGIDVENLELQDIIKQALRAMTTK
ncbi:MAG: Holliday junction branch migration protein RuvA [Oscillospiraceae bacterium]|nr:Holliday junction branch migration protein RuvA [Oscillospiraceae bacterium]